jgi:fibronectin-binding autotransporter adhesin
MKKNLRNRILAHVLALVSLPTFVFSATQTYDDTSASNVWNTTTTNWDGSTVVWTNGNDAVFAGTGEAVAVTTVSANKIDFNSTGYSLTGSTITLTGASPTITTAQDATITSIIAGSTGLVN